MMTASMLRLILLQVLETAKYCPQRFWGLLCLSNKPHKSNMDHRFHLAARWCTMSVFLHLVMMSCSEDAAEPINAIPGSFESMVAAGAQDRVVYIPEGDMLS